MLAAMREFLTAADVERQAAAAGLTIKDICARAGIAHTTFYRWRAGTTEPTLDVYRRIIDALPREAAA